jgi:hypothetical protein
MCAKSTGRALAFLSASGAAVSQEVADGKISISISLHSEHAINSSPFSGDATKTLSFAPMPLHFSTAHCIVFLLSGPEHDFTFPLVTLTFQF